MNAYTSFVKSISTDPTAFEKHIYFYLRMELALCKFQICKDLSTYETLKLEYKSKFSLLTHHIVEISSSKAKELNLDAVNQDSLILLQNDILNSGFDKTELDAQLEKLIEIFKTISSSPTLNVIDPKVLSLSA